jgi:hypothetical protein
MFKFIMTVIINDLLNDFKSYYILIIIFIIGFEIFILLKNLINLIHLIIFILLDFL